MFFCLKKILKFVENLDSHELDEWDEGELESILEES